MEMSQEPRKEKQQGEGSVTAGWRRGIRGGWRAMVMGRKGRKAACHTGGSGRRAVNSVGSGTSLHRLASQLLHSAEEGLSGSVFSLIKSGNNQPG